MKRRPLLLHIVTALTAAAAGWYAGAIPPEGSETGATRIHAARSSLDKPGHVSSAASAWPAQLSAVRAVPGAASEIAWIQWAMTIADADIPAAIARLNTRSDFHALRFLYARWVKLDPQAAWASFSKSDIPVKAVHFYLPEREDSRYGMLASSFHNQPRSLIAVRMLTSWMAVDPSGAREMVMKLRIKNSPEAKEVLISSYQLDEATGEGHAAPAGSGTELAAGVAAAQALPDGPERRKALQDSLSKWMTADATAACAWLRQLSPEDSAAIPFENISYGMKTAPAAVRAATLASLLEPRDVSAQVLAEHMELLRVNHWLSDDTRGIQDASTAVREWTAQDPDAAQQWLKTLPDNDFKALLAGEAAAALVRTDVNAAIALLNGTGGDQQLALKPFMDGWMQADARACIEWTAKIDDPAVRDSCLESAALSLASADPELSLSTAQSLGDPEARRKVFAAVRNRLTWNPAALEKMQAQFPGDDWISPQKTSG